MPNYSSRLAPAARQVLRRGGLLLVIVLLAGVISYLAMLAFFRGVYPLFVRDTLNGMLVSLYGAPDLSASAETRFTQGLIFMNGTLLSLFGTIIVSTVAYFIVTRAQEKAAETALNIERLRLLQELEMDIEAIQAAEAVHIKNVPDFLESAPYPFEVVLTKNFKWVFDKANGRRTRFVAGVGRMEMFLADNESLITTRVLHRTLNWYRRIDRGRDLGLVTNDDLYLMWRHILPLSTDGRFRFIDHYFGGTGRGGSEDVEAIRRTLVDVIIHVVANKKSAALDYLHNRVDPVLLEEAKRKSGLRDLGKLVSGESRDGGS